MALIGGGDDDSFDLGIGKELIEGSGRTTAVFRRKLTTPFRVSGKA